MTYTPKSEEQLAKEGLMSDGEYDFEVVETSDKPSKAGNTMFTLKLRIWDAEGNVQTLFDYIALGSNFGERKLRHAADACGLLEIYNSGKLEPGDFQGTSGKVLIKQDEGGNGYLPKNAVKDYVKRDPGAPQKAVAPKPALDDEIPFSIAFLLACSYGISSGMMSYLNAIT